MDDVLRRLDFMSDEELQAKYENMNYGPVDRVFIEAEEFFAFLWNEKIEEYTMPLNNSSIDSYICNPIETHDRLIGKKTLVSVKKL